MSLDNEDGPWGPAGNKNNDDKPKDPSNPWSQKNPGPGLPPDNQPPDLEAIIRKVNDWMYSFKPKGHFHSLASLAGIAFGLWILSGFYQVATNQMGVVMRFGAFNRMETPGLHYHLPVPFEEVLLPSVTAQNEIQIGYRQRGDGVMRSIPRESMMLTQDENLINVEFAVFWRVNDVSEYLFEIRDPEQTIKMAAESVIREVIGQNKLQFALTDGRSQIAEETRARLQALMDEYKAGVMISQINLQTVSVPEEVKDAFQDVINARLDQERLQNQAAAHVNKVIPEAKGQAAQMIQQAMAYRDQKIAIAKGEADRFKEVLTAYDKAKDVTARRLYLETLETVLGKVHKIVMDKSVGALPYLPLPDTLIPSGGKP